MTSPMVHSDDEVRPLTQQEKARQVLHDMSAGLTDAAEKLRSAWPDLPENVRAEMMSDRLPGRLSDIRSDLDATLERERRGLLSRAPSPASSEGGKP